MNDRKRPYVLSIAGLDPCGGAGILADIKTFEAHRVTGFGVCSAITYQNEDSLKDVKWLSFEVMKEQVEMLLVKYPVSVVKIGIVEHFKVVEQLVDFLLDKNADLKIVWDPIWKASAGYVFHMAISEDAVVSICRKIYLITPNREEMLALVPALNAEAGALKLSGYCHVLLKGGHNKDKKGKDELFRSGKQVSFSTNQIAPFPKHGSGCVLSAAITANLAKKMNLSGACRDAKKYITAFLHSNVSLLGDHPGRCD